MNNKKLKSSIEEGFLGQRMIVLPKNIIQTIKKNPLINALYFTDIGFFPKANYHSIRREKGSKEYILIYCYRGEGVISVENQDIVLKPNSFYILPPGVSHEYYANKSNPWSIYWIHFTGIIAQKFYLKFKSMDYESYNQIALKERRIVLFDSFVDILEDGYSPVNLEYVNLSLWQLLSTFLYGCFFTENKKIYSEDNTVESVIKLMKKNLDVSLKVKEMATKFNYSSSHFFTIFKKRTGYTPITYFNNMKIQKACQYLSFTDMSVKEVSFALGYNDPLYFSRLFKKTMSMSPLQYKKRYSY